jgi:hypothetical protein
MSEVLSDPRARVTRNDVEVRPMLWSQFSAIFDNFLRFSTIFGDFRQFSAIFDNFRRFSTIFGDFRQFSAKKLPFFTKTNVMIKILHNLALFWVKNANFPPINLEKIFKKSLHRSLKYCRNNTVFFFPFFFCCQKFPDFTSYYKIYKDAVTVITYLAYCYNARSGAL